MGFLNDIYQHLDPIAFQVGPFAVHWYGIAYLAGFICAGFIMHSIARRWKLELTADDLFMLITASALGVVIGGRLFYVVFYGAGYYWSHPLDILALSEGGMSFHGGLAGGLLAGFIACKYVLGLSFVTMCDLGAIAAPVGIFFGRCANFINGELWGKPTDLAWAVSFASGGSVPRHPSQLYEALLEGIVIFIVLYALSRQVPARAQGSFIGTFLMLYGIFRFVIEFVRVPDEQLGYLIGPITMGQILSLPLVIAGVIIVFYAYTKQQPQRGRVSASA